MMVSTNTQQFPMFNNTPNSNVNVNQDSTRGTQQNGKNFQKEYSENIYRVAGFSFPSNNLFLAALIKSVPKTNDKKFEKESYFFFITCVLGVTNDTLRTYDFNQKVAQKFSLKDLKSLSFALKELAKSNESVLPYTKFTNSGDGAKSLYLQSKTNDKQQTSIILGASWKNLKINTTFTKSDAYAVADLLDHLYELGMKLELDEQYKRFTESQDLNPIQNTGSIIPNNNSANSVSFPQVTPVQPNGNNQTPTDQHFQQSLVNSGNAFAQMMMNNSASVNR